MNDSLDMGDTPKDFAIEDLVLLKEMLLNLEKALDEIVVHNNLVGETFSGAFIFEFLAKANVGLNFVFDF